MHDVDRYLASPHLVDLILALTVLEAVILLLLRRWLDDESGAKRTSGVSGHDPNRRPLAIILMLLPGVCLMLALRAALDGAAWPWVPAALSAALVTHVADIHQRWRRR